MPKLSILVLPTMIAPAARSLATAVASYDGTWPSRILEPAVVCTPLVQRLSCRRAHKWVPDAEPFASNRTELAKRVVWTPLDPRSPILRFIGNFILKQTLRRPEIWFSGVHPLVWIPHYGSAGHALNRPQLSINISPPVGTHVM